MTSLKRSTVVNATLLAVILTLGIAFLASPGQLTRELRGVEQQAARRVGTVKPANFISSCSALIAVFCAWRSFTGYRRRANA